jgi:hypothetical protein
MRYEDRDRKSPVAIILAILFILAIAAGIYFLVDSMIVNKQIKAIDSIKYEEMKSEKTEQYELKGIPLAVSSNTESLNDNTYKTPLGFSIVSYSDKWTGQKLVDIYDELLKNGHGDEIKYVSEVDVYPGVSENNTNDFQIAGTQSENQEYYPVFFEIPSFIPESLEYTLSRTASVISLYNMDDFDTAAQAAQTIAHEYGHHYTIYYFLQDDDAALKSEYYKLRGFSGFGHDAIYDAASYYQNHEWDIYEIAAEDYVQLMGSPDAKQTIEYKDIKEILTSMDKKYVANADNNTVNVFPQENIYIPLADEVSGLRDYFYSFIGKKNDYEPIKRTDFNIQMSKHSNNGYKYYKITWDNLSADKEALYTLVCYYKNGDIFWPVKTVRGNEKPYAIVGTASMIRGAWIYWQSDNITKEDRLFKLYLILPDGQMQSSEIFNANF